jgi:S-DNA-T family DNA segregation ATPase FtsK/SpoIIIE
VAVSNQIIKGELVHAQPFQDDIAPGEIEYYPYRPPVLSRAGSAAMVAAAATGRTVGLTARTGWQWARWFGHGTRATAVLGHRYVRAHDHLEAIGGMTSAAGWNKIQGTRKRRWRFLGAAAGVVAAADLAAWWALVKYESTPALDWSWAAAPGTEAAVAAALLTLYGRYRLANRLAPQEVLAAADTDDGAEPFPLAHCRTADEVVECVGRALAYEGVGTRQIDILGHRTWGWEVDVTLKGSTPGKVNAVADQLDAHFDVKHGGTLVERDLGRSAHLTMRLVTDDPFANMPAPLEYAPNSLDVADPHRYGLSMDGRPLEFVAEGTRVLVIGSSGSAKSTGVLRDYAYTVTACHNAIALDLDPVKDGLREFEGVMAVPPIRGNEECELWLDYLVAMAEARNRVRTRLNMGDTWVATASHPAIFPIVDEFIYLSKTAKEKFIRLLRLGKQSGIYPAAAGQDATSDSLGDAIADSFTLRVMLASRHADIPLVFGTGAIAAGYRPDRLSPAQTAQITNDAGRSYIQGAGMDRPVLYGWDQRSRASVQRAVAERAAAGRPWFDHDTLAEADLLHLVAGHKRGAAAPSSMADRLTALGTPDAVVIGALLRLFEVSGARFLPTAGIVAAGVAEDGTALQALLARLVPTAKSTKDYVEGRQVRGWTLDVANQAAAVLFAPS